MAARIPEGMLGPLAPGALHALDALPGRLPSVPLGDLQVPGVLRAGAGGPQVNGQAHPAAGPGLLAGQSVTGEAAGEEHRRRRGRLVLFGEGSIRRPRYGRGEPGQVQELGPGRPAGGP